MQRKPTRTCPAWCVADHAQEDEGGRPRHRGATTSLPAIVLSGSPPAAHGTELLVELHADDGDPLVAVYIGDGIDGIDLSTESAARLVRRLVETLRVAGAAPL